MEIADSSDFPIFFSKSGYDGDGNSMNIRNSNFVLQIGET